MTEFTHVAVAAAPQDAISPEALLERIEKAVGERAPGPREGRVLGDIRPAAEARFVLDKTTDAAAIMRLLQADLGEIADLFVAREDNRRKRLLICDMDSTVIGQECLDELADYAGLKAEISAITERAMRGELDFEGALTERVAMLKGLGLDKLQRCYDERITLNAGARTLVETMKADGARCVLVSGGFTFFTNRVAETAGFQAHRGNTLLDDGETLTGAVGLPILGREAKLAALEEECAARGLSTDDAIALGDGANDLAMIKAAGLGLAYRAKPIVAAEADASITHTDLCAALYFQGYEESEFAEDA